MERQEMIEKGKTLFKSKSSSADEIEVWKQSSLKYQAKYQESIQINQEIKLLLESCLSAKEALIQDLAAANELIFQNDLKSQNRPCSLASKETQTLKLVKTIETQTELKEVTEPIKGSLKADKSSTSCFPASTQTEATESLTETTENLENAKSQLSHIRDAYERAQSQMQMLGNANAQLKLDLENEKKISALLEAEVNALPDYIQKYHTERKTLLEKLMYEREKVMTLTEKIQQISKKGDVIDIDIDKLTKKNQTLESVKTPSPSAPALALGVSPSLDKNSPSDTIIPNSIDNIVEEKSVQGLKSSSPKEKIESESAISLTKEPMVISPDIPISQQNTPQIFSNLNGPDTDSGSETANVSPVKSANKEVSPVQDITPLKDLPKDENSETPVVNEQVDQDSFISVKDESPVKALEVENVSFGSKTLSSDELKSNDSSSNHHHDAHLTVETSSKTKNVITPLVSPDIKTISSPPTNDTDLLSSASDNIPLALLYGQSICYNCQYYKDINL